MQQMISREEINELMKIKGEVRGIAMKNTADFVLKKEGREGLQKLEKVMAELGYPINYNRIKSIGFYPLNLLGLTLLVTQRLFKYTYEDLHEMGRFRSRAYVFIKIFINYFFSFEKAIKKVPEMWKKYFTVGELEAIDFDKKKKRGILRLKNYCLHPVQCAVMTGIYANMIQMLVKSKVTCKETKCIHKGDKYHEFVLEWE